MMYIDGPYILMQLYILWNRTSASPSSPPTSSWALVISCVGPINVYKTSLFYCFLSLSLLRPSIHPEFRFAVVAALQKKKEKKIFSGWVVAVPSFLPIPPADGKVMRFPRRFLIVFFLLLLRDGKAFWLFFIIIS